jgi:dihydroflavonol-4-reductase
VPGSTRNTYFEAKWVMEQEALRAAQTGLEVVALVPTTVFGPGDVKPATGQILRDLARGRFPISVHALTNFVDVREVAEAHLKAAITGHSGQRYIIGGHNLDIAEALRQAAEVSGVRPPLAALPHGLAVGLLRRVDGLPLPIPQTVRGLPYWQPLNCEKGWQTFGFTPRPFAQTAGDAIAWFREHGYV